jgi:hypothetical protein
MKFIHPQDTFDIDYLYENAIQLTELETILYGN